MQDRRRAQTPLEAAGEGKPSTDEAKLSDIGQAGNTPRIKDNPIKKRKFTDTLKAQAAHIETLQARLAALEEQV